MTEPLKLGISPCPNDTYIFYGLLNERVNTYGFEIETTFSDVQVLNEMAEDNSLDVVKISVAAYPKIKDHYRILRSGGALGWQCGPVLVAANKKDFSEIKKAKIAIPGRFTTANLLLKLHGQHQGPLIEKRYDHIIDSITSGECQAGLLIHEGRFTYQDYGLTKILDFGEWWEAQTKMPLPLGIIVAKRRLGQQYIARLEKMIQESIRFARQNPDQVWTFIRQHAQELDDQIIKKHIDTFVTDYSVDLGETGYKAINKLLSAYDKANC